MILSILLDGPCRFCELEHSVPGIGGRMLSERLKTLERHGIVERHAAGGPRTRVDYRLTPKGYGLEPAIHAIAAWADRWAPDVAVSG